VFPAQRITEGGEREDRLRKTDKEYGHMRFARWIEWPSGGRSIYFRDPAGNLVDLVTPGVWGLPSDW
jgi:hypothetical protein